MKSEPLKSSMEMVTNVAGKNTEQPTVGKINRMIRERTKMFSVQPEGSCKHKLNGEKIIRNKNLTKGEIRKEEENLKGRRSHR
jgi:hypothetical protein